MRATWILLSCLLLIAPLPACYRRPTSRGDGKLVEHGGRFRLSLGLIDFAKKQQKTFMLESLPHTEFVLGFRIRLHDTSKSLWSDEPRPNPLVAVTVVDELGRVVVQEQSRLDGWTWSGSPVDRSQSFVYHRQDYRERKPVVGADKGYGTYFTPRRRGKYTLTINVVDPDLKATGCDAELMVDEIVVTL